MQLARRVLNAVRRLGSALSPTAPSSWIVVGESPASRRGAVGLPLLALTVLGIGAASAGVAALHLRPWADRSAFQQPAAVYGPKDFIKLSGGSSTIHVDSFTVSGTPGATYRINLESFAPSNSALIDSASVQLNGKEIFRPVDFANGPANLTRLITLQPSNTLRVTIAKQSTASSTIRLTILPIATASFTLYGPQEVAVPAGQTTTTFSGSFVVPADAGPDRFLEISNGGTTGANTLPASSGVWVKVNGTQVLSTPSLPQDGDILSQSVALQSSNVIEVGITNGVAGGKVTVRLAASDTAHPKIQVDAPVPNARLSATTATITGTVIDHTPTALLVNGTAATVGQGGSFSATVALPSDGQHNITLKATDAAGLITDSVRTVLRDTEAPVLTVSAPLDQAVVGTSSINVQGTASDAAGSVTVAVNGVPLPPDGTGAFAGTTALTEGANFLNVTATDQAGNQSSVMRQVTLDTQAPSLTLSEPLEGTNTTLSNLTVRGVVTDASAVTLTVNGAAVTPGAAGAFEASVALTTGQNVITALARDAAGHESTVTRTVTRGEEPLPPDPSIVAPALDQTKPTNVADATAFLYTGANPIQTGVTPGTIVPRRAALVRGRVLTRALSPLAGVTVTVHGRPELGQTRSRADGWFDLAVNGGGELVISYEKSGYLPAQRTIRTAWQDYFTVDSVALIPVDTAVTPISFTQPIEVARATPITDEDGTRRATLLFAQGTQATLVMPDGTSQPLTGPVHVRATEYTVGAGGPAAMPAPLPAPTAYTYAAELSLDEAITAGASSVQFSKPVTFYVENFLNYPVGTWVPFGYYDRQKARWIAEQDGRVVKVLSIVSGKAVVAVDSTQNAASATQLTAMGFTDAELTQVATLYTPGQTLWRTRHSHFSPGDWNVSFVISAAARAPGKLGEIVARLLDKTCNKAGSIVACENQALGEVLPITGTSASLVYHSNRARGYTAGSAIELQLSDTAALPPTIESIVLDIQIAGRQYFSELPPQRNLRTTFTWDGKDVYGRTVVGAQTATIRRGYRFSQMATVGGGGGSSFGSPPGTGVGTLASRSVFDTILWTDDLRVSLGSFRADVFGLGGWGVDVLHRYEPGTRTLLLGDGSRRTVNSAGMTLEVVSHGFSYERSNPERIAILPDGSLIVPHSSDVWRYATNGTRTRIAGGGTGTADSIPALTASIGSAKAVAVGPDGSIYVAEYGNMIVSRIAPDGTYWRVAGQRRVMADSANGIPARNAKIGAVTDIALAPDGSIYLADASFNKIRQISPDGIIRTIAGNGGYPYPNPDGQKATAVALYKVNSVAVGPDGNVYVGATGVVHRLNRDGTLKTIAGFWQFPGSTPATQVRLQQWTGQLSFDRRGAMLLTDANLAYRVTSTGDIQVVAGRRDRAGTNQRGMQATEWYFDYLSGVAEAPDGSLVLTNPYNHGIYRVVPAMPGLTFDALTIASEDGGAIYHFDASGRHLRTQDAITKKNLLSFGYDSAGRLSAVTDALGKSVTVERDGGGQPLALVAPYGQRTTLATDGLGNLSTVTNPASERIHVYAGASGLLDSLTNARGYTSRFAYTNRGLLTRDDNAADGSQTLTRIATDTLTRVDHLTAEGLLTRFETRTLPGDTLQRRVTGPEGLTTVSKESASGVTTVRSPDGTVATVRMAPDPRWGLQAPYAASGSVTLPSGLASSWTAVRRVVLADTTNPLSVTRLGDTVTVNGKRTSTTYEAATRKWTTTSPALRQVVSFTDTLGRVMSSQVGGLLATTYAYDSAGRLERVTNGGRVVRYAYDAKGRLLSTTDPLGRRDSLFYDDADRLVRRITADGRTIGFAYDSTGNLIGLTPPGRSAHGFDYSATDLPTGTVPPSVGAASWNTRFGYDRDGRLASVVRPDGDSIVTGYDAGGRLSNVRTVTGTTTFAYSATTGQLTSLTAPDGGTLGFTWNGALPTGTTWTGTVAGRVGFAYDADLRVSKIAVNGTDTVAYMYDADGLLTRAGQLGLQRRAADGFLARDSIGSVKASYTYTARGEVQHYAALYGTDTLLAVRYGRDSLARITTLTETTSGTVTVRGFGYDSAGRLQTVTENGQLVASYSYDANGNRTGVVTTAGTLTGTVDDQDRLVSFGSATYTYMRAGALRAKVVGADTTMYVYDALSNLRSVRLANGQLIEYITDAQNRRIGRKVDGTLVQGFLWQSQLAPAAELDGSGAVVARFIYGTSRNVPDYIVKGGSTYRVVTDHLGSVRLVVNATTGTVAQRLTYDAWGQIIENSNPGFQPFGYAGGILDHATGLTRFGVRDYDAYAGRWTTKDPMGFAAGDLNLFAYASSNPITFSDPTGYCIWDGCILEAAAVGLATGFVIDLAMQYLASGTCDFDYAHAAAAGGADAILSAATLGLNKLLVARRIARASDLSGRIDAVIASSQRARSSQITEGARSIAKKQGHAARDGFTSAFDGIQPNQANAEGLIRDIMGDPHLVDLKRNYIEAYNPLGQGIRLTYRNDFVGFMEILKWTP